MGNAASLYGGILHSSPLGCVWKHWKDLVGDLLMQKQLVEYCNHWWPMYTLDSGGKWRKNGTLKYSTTLQLILFCRREGKWDEVSYVDLFFTLRNNLEWQKQCGMLPHDSMVLALEGQKSGKNLKQCCLACSNTTLVLQGLFPISVTVLWVNLYI